MFDELLLPEGGKAESFAFATVTDADGSGALIDGEPEPSALRRLASYSPANGDRVLVASVMGARIMLGRVV